MFFKKRAVLEEEYGRGMHKLAKNTAEVYAMNDGKAGYVGFPHTATFPTFPPLLPFFPPLPYLRPLFSIVLCVCTRSSLCGPVNPL